MATPRNEEEEGTVSATEFKARCLVLIERVARTRVPLLVTKHGRPSVRILPASEPQHALAGSVTLVAGDPESYYSAGEGW